MQTDAVDQVEPAGEQVADWTPPSWEDVVRDHEVVKAGLLDAGDELTN